MFETLLVAASRRSFLSKLAGAAAALSLSILGIKSAYAGTVETFCCNLCETSDPFCSGGACAWCWYCVYEKEPGICMKYQCIERYHVGGDCENGADCNPFYLKCSRAVYKGLVSCTYVVPACTI